MQTTSRYRFILLDDSQMGSEAGRIYHVIDNSTNALNSIQEQHQFFFERNVVSLPTLEAIADGSLLEDGVCDFILSYRKKVGFTEYPIGIILNPLHGGIWMNVEDDCAVISLHEHQSRSNSMPSKVLKYLVALVVLEQLVKTPSHDDVQGCVNDFADDPKYIDFGIRTADICQSCQKIIRRAVFEGRATVLQVAAIWRILDDVAGRRFCFVIMPFRDFMKPVLACVQSAASTSGIIADSAEQDIRPNLVMHKVIEMLARSEYCVADLTDLSPNVLYELGYAHALTKPVLLICQDEKRLPFDLGHHHLVRYESTQLAETLEPILSSFFAH